MLFKLLNLFKRKRKITDKRLNRHIKMLEHQEKIEQYLETINYYDNRKQII